MTAPEAVGGTAFLRPGRVLRGLSANPAAAVGTAVVALFFVVALLGPLLAPYGPNEQNYAEARRPPTVAHPFGTDHLGRDVFSRVVLGARDVLTLAGIGTLAAVAAGAAVGLVVGYAGGWLEEVVFRALDGLLAMPPLLFALLLLGSVGPSRGNVAIVLALAYAPIVARVVRSVVLSTKVRDWVAAARLQGEPTVRILLREILPATLPTLAVEAALRFSYAIFLVASLGFLGAGVQPPSPDWGLMVAEARTYASLTPWALWFPAAAISILVVSVNLMADGLASLLRPDA